MVIKRTEEVVEMPNGNRVHCYENHTTLDELNTAASSTPMSISFFLMTAVSI